MNRRNQAGEQCEARVAPPRGGHRCQFAGWHRHTIKPAGVDDLPVVVHVCGNHLRMLIARERHEDAFSEAELLDDWLRP